MTILTRQERERLVIDLYNQGKTYREIFREARISPRDTRVILNKVIEEKNNEGSKDKEQDDAEKTDSMNNTFLYLPKHTNSFPNVRLTPLEVAIALNLRVRGN